MMPIQSMQNIFNNNNMNDIQEPKKEEIILLFETQSNKSITTYIAPPMINYLLFLIDIYKKLISEVTEII